MNKNPLSLAWNQGFKVGKDEATDIFHKFLMERMDSLSDIPGVGEKTEVKIREHFLEGMMER